MKIITPTPSQAAVVLRDFCKKVAGLKLSLGHCQEAVARIYGYASWNVLTASIKPRRIYLKPAHSENTQEVGTNESADELTIGQWKALIAQASLPAEGESHKLSAQEVFEQLEQAIAKTRLFSERGFERMPCRDEMLEDEDEVAFQISYDRRHSALFGTELVVSVRDGQLDVYIRTWLFRDGLDLSQDYEILNEDSGDFDVTAKRPDDSKPLSALLRAALREYDMQHVLLFGFL